MSAEKLPEPPLTNTYAHCVLAEHDQPRFASLHNPDLESIEDLAASLYRHNHPYRHLAKQIGGYAFSCFISMGRALSAMPMEEQSAQTPPLDS
ncbi:MAG TPA: hypothetical protein VHC21_04330 [Candidatus Saccharimonadales bacterium]|nr:hypothetical protein [Candidatus Saccharimonadales bacterium]